MSGDDDILETYINDAKTARRGAVLSAEGKTRITMYLDNRVLEHFREVATAKGRGYQTEINDYLAAGIRKGQQAGAALVVAGAGRELQTRLGADGQSVDWFLQELVDFVNESEGSEIGMTLHVEGCIVTGSLVNAHRWFKDLAGQLEANGISEGVSRWIRSFGDVYAKPAEGPADEWLPPAYLHLRNARVFGTSGESVPTEGVYWRGRVNAVSGFNIGTLGPAGHG